MVKLDEVTFVMQVYPVFKNQRIFVAHEIRYLKLLMGLFMDSAWELPRPLNVWIHLSEMCWKGKICPMHL